MPHLPHSFFTSLFPALLVAFILAVISWTVQEKLESDTQFETSQSLQTVLNTTQRAVHSWLDGHLHDILLRSNSSHVQQLTKRLLQEKKTPTDLLKSPAQYNLRVLLNSITKAMGYVEYDIVGPDYINLASNLDERVGQINPLMQQKIFLDSVWAGSPALSMPIKFDTGPATNGNQNTIMFVGAPIYEDTKVIAIFTFGIDAVKEFSVIFETGRIGASGETYAFDNQGWLISESRFVSQLRSLGIIYKNQQSIQNVQLVIRKTESQKKKNTEILQQHELTKPVQMAINGHSGVEMNGARDYRGSNVVSAWLWDKDLNMGMVTEQEVNEAYKTLGHTKEIITGLTMIAIALLIVLSLFYSYGRRKLLSSQKALQHSEIQLRSIIDNSADGIITLDKERNIQSYSPAAEKIFGFSEHRMLHKSFDMLVASSDRKRIADYMAELNNADNTPEMSFLEIHGLRQNGITFDMDLSIGYADMNNDSVYISVVRDITERKRLEAQGRRQLEMLAHAARMSSVGEMSSGIAHELNQPLTAIYTYAKTCLRIMQTSAYDETEIKNILDNISEQANRAGELIRRFRMFVKKEKYTEIEADINKIIEEAMHIVESQIRFNGITVQFSSNAGLPTVNVDPIKIQQVLVNLLQNAIDAIMERKDTAKTIKIAAVCDDKFIEVYVINNGIHISEDDHQRFFEPFYTTKEDGLGLGLPISQSIIFLHGGKLWFSADEGETRFHFTLPIATV